MRRSLAIAFVVALFLAAAPVAHAAKLGSRQIRTGSHGSDVVQLQKALRALGYKLSADGDFGPITDRAVRSYERGHHLKVDGIVGSSEARAILADAAAAKASKPPSTGGTAPSPPADPPPPVDPPPTDPPPSPATHVFPVQGSFSFGGAGSRFGAPRSGHTHQGQDVTAADGTRLVSVSAGVVYWRRYQDGGAGNYVVISGDDGFDYVYMHLREGALVMPGDRVDAGQPIGHVGQTGAAEGPHLHFELWTGGHWQAGGHPIDPLPFLQSWL
jgi:murein DD-endopeptidase MepM/ murein hydrolase activator NlpD